MITKKLPLVFLIISVLLFTAGLLTAQEKAESPPDGELLSYKMPTDFVAKAGTMLMPLLNYGSFGTAPPNRERFPDMDNYLTNFALWVGGVDASGNIFVVSGDGNEISPRTEWIPNPIRTKVRIDKSSLVRNFNVKTEYSDEIEFRGHIPVGLKVTQVLTTANDKGWTTFTFNVENTSETALNEVYIGFKAYIKAPGKDNMPFKSDTRFDLTSAARIPYVSDSNGKKDESKMISLVPGADRNVHIAWWGGNSKLSDEVKYNYLKGTPEKALSNRSYNNSVLISAGPFTLLPERPEKLTVAVVQGKGEANLESRVMTALPSAPALNIRKSASDAITSELTKIPDEFRLIQNYPNPFNPSTTIAYHMKEAGNVSITVYDITGKEVANLVSDTRPAGIHSVTWNGRNTTGNIVASGVYLYKIRVTNSGGVAFQSIKRMAFIK